MKYPPHYKKQAPKDVGNLDLLKRREAEEEE